MSRPPLFWLAVDGPSTFGMLRQEPDWIASVARDRVTRAPQLRWRPGRSLSSSTWPASRCLRPRSVRRAPRRTTPDGFAPTARPAGQASPQDRRQYVLGDRQDFVAIWMNLRADVSDFVTGKTVLHEPRLICARVDRLEQRGSQTFEVIGWDEEGLQVHVELSTGIRAERVSAAPAYDGLQMQSTGLIQEQASLNPNIR